MSQYVKFNYLYRDAGNYKSWGELVFPNPENLDLKEIDDYLKTYFEQGAFFIAHQIDVPEVFIYATETLNSDDHCFHEYDTVECLLFLDGDIEKRSINQFLEQVRTASILGWEAFNPLDRIEKIKKGIC